MKIGHAAAIGLVGWYLMTPPINHAQLNQHAPLSQWRVFQGFDKANDCSDTQLRQQSATRANAKADPSFANKAVADAMLNSQCIASDDPRLKR